MKNTQFKMLCLAVLLVFPSLSKAMIKSSFFCGKSYRYESFAVAKAYSIKGTNSMFMKRPKVLDEMCFRMGLKKGKELLTSSFNCKKSFDRGVNDGRELLDNNGHNACYQAGFEFIKSMMIIDARQAKTNHASKDCVKAYHQGKLDAKNLRARYQYSREHLLEYCYDSGYTDAELFGDLI